MTETKRATTPATNEQNGTGREVVVGSYGSYREAADAVELLKNLRVKQRASIVPRCRHRTIGLLAYAAGQDGAQTGERWEAGRYDVVTDEANAEEARLTLRDKVGARA